MTALSYLVHDFHIFVVFLMTCPQFLCPRSSALIDYALEKLNHLNVIILSLKRTVNNTPHLQEQRANTILHIHGVCSDPVLVIRSQCLQNIKASRHCGD